MLTSRPFQLKLSSARPCTRKVRTSTAITMAAAAAIARRIKNGRLGAFISRYTVILRL